MKRMTSLILALLCLCLCGCGKNTLIRGAEEKIAAMQTSATDKYRPRTLTCFGDGQSI